LQPTQRGADGVPDWPVLRAWLARRAGLIDAVVFSGGEPTADMALPQAMTQARALALRVGLHTAGMLPQRLQQVLPLADWVGLDIKAPLADAAAYERITGVRGSAAAVRRSLAALQASGVAFECRTTAHPALLDDAALLALASGLAASGVANWALQICRPVGVDAALHPVGDEYPQPATLTRLRSMVAGFTLRRG
jgi:anaerobic ribonucleoside-triphosphate reductase activating protein